MVILGSSDGGNQRFYKQKAQVLQLNGAGHLKRGGETAPQGLDPRVPVLLIWEPCSKTR